MIIVWIIPNILYADALHFVEKIKVIDNLIIRPKISFFI